MKLNDLPAIYATEPYPGVSSSYVFIPTRPVIEKLESQGWKVVDARQTRSRSVEKAPYARHMLRLRHTDETPIVDPRGNRLFAEMVFINGHDGTATYRLLSGLFSMLCLNGLVVGSMLGGATIRHTGMKATLEAVELGALKIVAEEIPRLSAAVINMAERLISRSQQHDFARRALELRYKGVPPLLTTDQLLTVHRKEDEGSSVWTTLNVIQENVLSQTHHSISLTGRRSNIRAVKEIKASISINRGLWDYAEKLAA